MTVRRLVLEDRFWSKVDKTGDCWLWTGGRTTNGYGRINVDGRNERTHRVARTLTNGTIPSGLNVLHRCDNRLCVNPLHLFLGTIQDNSLDMIAKGRGKGQWTPKPHCRKGHIWTPETTLRDSRGHRVCRLCKQAWTKTYANRNRKAA